MNQFAIQIKLLFPTPEVSNSNKSSASHLFLLAMNAVIFFFIFDLLLFEYCKDAEAALLRCIW